VEGKQRSPLLYLVIVSIVADVLGILEFLKFSPGPILSFSLALFLGSLAVIIGSWSLILGIRLWAVPRGSYYPAAVHWKNIVLGLIVATIGVVAGWYLMNSTLEQVGGMTRLIEDLQRREPILVKPSSESTR